MMGFSMLTHNARPGHENNQFSSPLRNRCTATTRPVLCKANVSFSVKMKTSYGDNIRVVGDHSSLGKWKADQGAKLSWQEGDVWTADLELPDDVTINYKVVNYRRRGKPLWEKGDNRSLAVGSTDVSVKMRWDNTQNGSITYAEPDFIEEDSIYQREEYDVIDVATPITASCPTMSDILRTYAINASVDV